MTHTQKIKVVLEVDLTEEDRIIPRRSLQYLDNDSDTLVEMDEQSPSDLVHEQTLLTALQADPLRYAEFVRTLVIYSLDILGMNEGFARLASLKDTCTASLQVLEEVVPHLPPAARAHFQQTKQEGWLSEGTGSVYNAIQVTPVSLRVEYPGTPT